MARLELDTDYEKRSYSYIFLLAVACLLAGAVWAIYDDNFLRRPWKDYQWNFARLMQQQLRDGIAAENKKLDADPAYQQLEKDRAAAQQKLATGETAKRIAGLQAELKSVGDKHYDFDINLRIQKSRLEQAWYEYESALHEGGHVEPLKKHIEELETVKVEYQKGFEDTKARIAQIEAEIRETQSEVTSVTQKMDAMAAERVRLEQRLSDSLLTGPLSVFGLSKIPNIKQVVLKDFDRNNYDQPTARVERCESCHIGIDRPGFEDQPNPFKTHPRRAEILGKHPTDQFGCTPCHGGQGAAVNSIAKGHGEVVHWDDPLLRGEKLQSSCISCHSNVKFLPGAEQIALGETLFEELGCIGCHLVQGYEDLPKVAPNLRRIGAKAEPAWLVRWVTNPHEFRPKTRMPNFLFDAEQGTKIAAYLLSSTKSDSEDWLKERPLPAGVNPADKELVARGQELVNSVGCRGCHGFAPGESPALLGKSKDIAPNLSNVAEKTDARWIYYWIKNPRMYSPEARMPSLRLSDEEAVAITSYLLTLGTPKPDTALAAKLADPEEIKAGEKLVRKYGCAGCHNVTGMEKESRIGVELTSFGSKLLTELFFGDTKDIPHNWEDWTFNKLKTPRIYATERIEQVMPKFGLQDDDIVAIRHFLRSRKSAKPDRNYRADTSERAAREIAGGRVVARYNCQGCHVIEGKGGAIRAFYQEKPQMAPPILNGEGGKVQSTWFFHFLKQPVPLRPWLKVRMPTFGLDDTEAKKVVEYFGALSELDNPYVHIDDAKIPSENLLAAQTLVSKDYFSCFSCHQRGDKSPEGKPEEWAPDLGMAHERLNPNWIVRWLRNPQKVMPGTKMPSFYEEGEKGEPTGGPDDIFEGDGLKQIQALRDYLMVLSKVDHILAQRGVKKDEPVAAAGDGANSAM